MDTNLWLAPVAALGGIVLGGGISYILNLQQIKAAEVSRRWDLRYDAYADFLKDARRYRNAIRPESGPSVAPDEIRDLERTADASGSLVFLVNKSPETKEACGLLMKAMSDTSRALKDSGADMTGERWDKLDRDMSKALRKFQDAARAELGVDDAGAQTSDP